MGNAYGTRLKIGIMEKPNIINERYPHLVKIVRVITDDDPFNDNAEQEIVLYENKGRSYTQTTTEGDKIVDENKRKASIPVRYDEWDANKQPLDGDMIYVTIGNNTEVGIVKDCEPDNNRTVVYWNLRRV